MYPATHSKEHYAINEAILAWAMGALQFEVEHGFARAQIFNGFVSSLKVGVLSSLPLETQRLLTKALPTGAGSTGPNGEKALSQLALKEREAVREYLEEVDRVWRARHDESSDRIARMRHKDVVLQAKHVRKLGIDMAKKSAVDWGYAAEQVTPAIWGWARKHWWGNMSIQLDFETNMELRYGILLYDHRGAQVRRHDHYLGVLGIAPSVWYLESEEKWEDRILEALRFIRWHADEYERTVNETLPLDCKC
jgi:hypothetical protein